MNCREFKEIADSYLDDELLVETNHDVLQHLENCAGCRTELAGRRELRLRLRSAVKNSAEMQIDPVFRARLAAGLRETALRPTLLEKIKSGGFLKFKPFALAAAALAVILIVFGIVRFSRPGSGEEFRAGDQNPGQRNGLPFSTPTPLIQAAQAAWHEAVQKAVGDHQNCAIKFRLEEKPISLDEAAEKYGKYNKDLDQTVKVSVKEFPAPKPVDKIEFLEAHSCIFQGRRFAHIVLRYRRSIVSILVSEAEFPAGSDQTISTESSGNLQAAGFHVANHAVFVVSDLSEADNLAIARQIQPAIKRHIDLSEV